LEVGHRDVIAHTIAPPFVAERLGVIMTPSGDANEAWGVLNPAGVRAADGDLRDDVAPDELASYCLHALTAASSLPSKAAVRRLVNVILAGLRPQA
jgi:hypothetical protein